MQAVREEEVELREDLKIPPGFAQITDVSTPSSKNIAVENTVKFAVFDNQRRQDKTMPGKFSVRHYCQICSRSAKGRMAKEPSNLIN